MRRIFSCLCLTWGHLYKGGLDYRRMKTKRLTRLSVYVERKNVCKWSRLIYMWESCFEAFFFFAQLVLPFCRVSIVLLWDSDEKSYKWKVGFSRWRNRKKLDNIWSHFFCACDGKRPKKEGELKEKLFECRGPRNT